MNILVVYSRETKKFPVQEAALRHCFEGEGRRVFYLKLSDKGCFPQALSSVPFDLAVFCPSFLALRYTSIRFENMVQNLREAMQNLPCQNVFFPKREALCPGALLHAAQEWNVTTLYTIASKAVQNSLYPAKHCPNTLQIQRYKGEYWEQYLFDELRECMEFVPERKWTLSCARGELFWEDGAAAIEIENDAIKLQQIFEHNKELPRKAYQHCFAQPTWGKEWDRQKRLDLFLNSRAVFAYASFGDVLIENRDMLTQLKTKVVEKNHSIPIGVGKKIEPLARLPKTIYEATACGCVLVLWEGDYHDLVPNVHYFELKRDFSNLTEIVLAMEDRALCRRMQKACQKQLFLASPQSADSGYAQFANELIEALPKENQGQDVDSFPSSLRAIPALTIAPIYQKKEYNSNSLRFKRFFKKKFGAAWHALKTAPYNTYMKLFFFLFHRPALLNFVKKVLFYNKWGKN